MAFLGSVGFVDGAGRAVDASMRAHHVRLLSLASSLGGFFRLDSPFAPGAFFCGGIDTPTAMRPAGNYAGRGLSLGHAFASTIGEAAEYRAMHRIADAPRVTSAAGAERVTGRSLTSGKTVNLPVSECLRNASGNGLTSTGYAAGPTLDAAVESALLECVERDAIARWSSGEHVPSLIESGFEEALTRVRRTPNRTVTFADITPSGGLAPVVAAISEDASGALPSLGTCFGFGAAPSLQAACAKALLELCQGEIGLIMIARKRRDQGDAALLLKERQALDRARAYHTGDGLLALRLAAGRPAAEPACDLAAMLASARSKALDIKVFDLTTPDENIPVAKVVGEGFLDAASLSDIDGLPPLL